MSKLSKKVLKRKQSTYVNEQPTTYDELEKPLTLQKPPNQLDLPDEELQKDVIIILNANNPYFSENFIEFSFKNRTYRPVTNFPNTVIFFELSGSIEHKVMLEIEDEAGSEKKESTVEELDTKRKNKFNFCDRAIQTINLLQRDQALQTEPPPQIKFLGTASPAEITLAYEEKEEADELRKNNDKKIKTVRKSATKLGKVEQFLQHARCFRLCERMVNQNLLFEVNVDFSFYDNPSDEFMDKGLGSLLPLWRFKYRPMKGMSVTSLSWNTGYPDMFAVGFGTHDINLRQQKGCVCVYSLKCPSYPEKVILCKSNVQSIQFNKLWPYLLAVGFTEGTVAVYDMRRESSTPFAVGSNSNMQHNDIINQVKWLSDNIDVQHNFCSVSADGKVINWLIAKSELLPSEVVNVKQKDFPTMGPEGILINAASGGTSICFNCENGDLFLVATENGNILKCSNLYTAQFLDVYRDHTNIVYSVQWNPFHPRVFLSCSADWTIRIWDHNIKESVFIFDLFTEVKDVAWAPFSSSLFAAVTKHGKVHVFDLTMNRQQPTCSYTVYSPQKNINLTTVQFNPIKPVLIIGDDRGCVLSFKLSPNLRSSLKALLTVEKSKFVAGEIDKMEKVLKLANSREGENR